MLPYLSSVHVCTGGRTCGKYACTEGCTRGKDACTGDCTTGEYVCTEGCTNRKYAYSEFKVGLSHDNHKMYLQQFVCILNSSGKPYFRKGCTNENTANN
jgi:hypothetical protein